MNMWGFTHSFLPEAKARFAAFLDDALQTNPLKGEYFLPSVVSQLVGEGKARVKVLHSPDKWYGVTYQDDKPVVVAAIAEKTAVGPVPGKSVGGVRMRQPAEHTLPEALAAFDFGGQVAGALRYGQGHINDTFCVYMQTPQGDARRLYFTAHQHRHIPAPGRAHGEHRGRDGLSARSD